MDTQTIARDREAHTIGRNPRKTAIFQIKRAFIEGSRSEASDIETANQRTMNLWP
jgi:hypothetical protein